MLANKLAIRGSGLPAVGACRWVFKVKPDEGAVALSAALGKFCPSNAERPDLWRCSQRLPLCPASPPAESWPRGDAPGRRSRGGAAEQSVFARWGQPWPEGPWPTIWQHHRKP